MPAIIGVLAQLWEKIHSRKFVMAIALGWVGYELVNAGKLEGTIYFASMCAVFCVYCLVQGSLDKDDSSATANGAAKTSAPDPQKINEPVDN